MSARPHGSAAIRVPAWRLAVLVVAGFCLWHDTPVSDAATSPAATKSGDLKIRTLDGKKLTLQDWTLEGDTLRGTREVWVDYERVRKPVAFSLGEVTLQDSGLGGEGLRAVLEAKQGEVAAREGSVPGATPKDSIPQPASSPASAARFRFRPDASHATWVYGTLLRSNPDSLWLLGQGVGDTLAVGRAKAARIQTFNGRTSEAGKGALIGGGVGVAIALGLIAAYSSDLENPNAGYLLLGTAIFGAGGALIGALIGGLIRKDDWVDVSRAGLSVEGSGESTRMSAGIDPPRTESPSGP